MDAFVTFAPLPEVGPVDLTVDAPDFTATSMRLTGTTLAGQDFLASMFGAGCVDVTVAKSKAADLMRFAEQRGLRVL